MGIVKILILSYVVFSLFNLLIMGQPIPKIVKKCKKKAYMINSGNRIDYQHGSDCSGYSSAFVFRHLGIDIDGVTAYNQIPFKLPGGSVTSMGIILLCIRYKVKVLFRIGNIEALKDSLCKGKPIVILSRIDVESKWLHYITVVGFDEDYIYVVDSMEENKNIDSELYNRRIPTADFKKIWHTSKIYAPLMTNLFFEMGKHSMERNILEMD